MHNSKTSPRFLNDFAGRRVTATAIFFAAVGSAGLNIWGATQIFPNLWTATAFATVVTAGEVIAFLALRHIMADRDNNHFWKARLGMVILCLAIAGCVISGHRAFHTLSLEAAAKHESNQIRAQAAQAEADKYFAIFLADDRDVNRAAWSRRQDLADEAKLTVLKSEPVPKSLVYIFLALFETVKIGGLYALATPSTRGQTWAQRAASKRQTKIAEAKRLARFKQELAAAAEADDTNVVELRQKA